MNAHLQELINQPGYGGHLLAKAQHAIDVAQAIRDSPPPNWSASDARTLALVITHLEEARYRAVDLAEQQPAE